jgi:anthraniloyl-CoA monooxygenase
MRLNRVAILGGGPGGLYAARLIKRALPDATVEVFEQGTPDTTFGFGVGLAAGTQRNLRAADPDSLEDILANAHPHDMSLRVGERTVQVINNNLRAVARTTLLTVLQRQARAAGVALHFGSRTAAESLDADLIIAVDGVSSATRDARATAFGAQIDIGDALYLWCGTEFALPRALFMPVTTDAGPFVTHAYPYSPDRSTFLIETDEQTWRRAGFDVTTDALATGPLDASDDVALAYLSEAFADPLEGHPLIGNRTRWLRFRTVRCDRWSDGNTVLLGDAAHTAHYSIGSGTKLAMEDAIALVDALAEEADVPAALHRYETIRRPAVEHLQAVAARSQQWWDTFPTRLDRPINQLMVSYMTRAGKVPITRFAQTSPGIVQAALTEYAGSRIALPADLEQLVTIVVDRPLGIGDMTFPTRLAALPENTVDIELAGTHPWGPKGDAAVAAGRDSISAGACALRITGPADRASLLSRLDLAERLRGGTVPIAVRGTEADLPDLAAGLLSGRTDLIEST